MTKPFTFELVSPEKLVFSGEAEMVVIPAEEGDLGVLAEHAPLIATVRPGVIRVYNNGAVSQRVFVAGGFVEVTKDRCTMLADAAMDVTKIDRAAAEQDLLKLVNESPTATDRHAADVQNRKMAVAKAKVAAAS
jgi:F-type H+-transporting ATPase subunit epsilon